MEASSELVSACSQRSLLLCIQHMLVQQALIWRAGRVVNVASAFSVGTLLLACKHLAWTEEVSEGGPVIAQFHESVVQRRGSSASFPRRAVFRKTGSYPPRVHCRCCAVVANATEKYRATCSRDMPRHGGLGSPRRCRDAENVS